ncbi:MAG TPA: hypothetical protein PKN48_13560 [Bacteroidales bacterium]|nr:hypothetical protein [Bacteroidales bacterium]
MKKIFLILIAIIVFTLGCEKNTLKEIYGKYSINTYTVNGSDSLGIYLDTLGPEFRFYYNDVTYNKVCVIGEGLSNNGYTGQVIWVWELLEKNDIIKVLSSSGAYYGTGPIGGTITSEWEIINLTKNEFKIKTMYNNKEYFVSMKKLD